MATFSTPASVRKDKRYALVLPVTGGSPSAQMNHGGCTGTLFQDTNKDERFGKEPASFGKVVFSTVVTT